MTDLTREELDAAGDWAFPARHTPEHSPGMTLRDWFAGQALAGLMAGLSEGSAFLGCAREAYELADAMLKVRSTVSRPQRGEK